MATHPYFVEKIKINKFGCVSQTLIKIISHRWGAARTHRTCLRPDIRTKPSQNILGQLCFTTKCTCTSVKWPPLPPPPPSSPLLAISRCRPRNVQQHKRERSQPKESWAHFAWVSFLSLSLLLSSSFFCYCYRTLFYSYLRSCAVHPIKALASRASTNIFICSFQVLLLYMFLFVGNKGKKWKKEEGHSRA